MLPLEFWLLPRTLTDAEISVAVQSQPASAGNACWNCRTGQNGEPLPWSIEVRRKETEAASGVLGIVWRNCLDLPNRSFSNFGGSA